jgi:hypothetical protein
MFGGAVLVGTAWWAVGDHARERRIVELEQERTELQRVISRLKDERRVAQIEVVDQTWSSDNRVASTTIEFVALGREGEVGRAKRIMIPGDVCYVDALVIRFLDEYVEKGDALRGHSLHLFRRIFGEDQRPLEGYPLDEPGMIPDAYRSRDEPSQFERRLWQRFWEYAGDPSMAREAGVRLAQGEAAYQRLRMGQRWKIATRADGGLEMTPLGDGQPPKSAPPTLAELN